MSDVAIRVEGLNKRYQIAATGTRTRYKTLQEDLLDLPRRLWSLARGNPDKRETFWALKDVSFEVKQGEVLGVIGRNGAGKSTLLKILSRITEPTSGQAEIYGRVGSLLEVGTGFHQELTGRENIYLSGAVLGMTRREVQGKFDEIVDFAGIEKFIDTPAKHYSSGMYMRLAFAVAAHLEPEILLVDEVLAVGDAEFQKKCLGKMGEVAREGRTVVFVSHNMNAIERLSDEAVLFDSGIIQMFGDVREAISLYLRRVEGLQCDFRGQPLTKISIRQVNHHLELSANFQVDRPIALPCLGFVISDYLGRPVCGSNPLLGNVTPLAQPRPAGTVTVLIHQPKLLNGVYSLSVWFGDGVTDFFSAKDCVAFEVVNMVDHKIRQLSPLSVGPVSPECQWQFS